MSELVFERGLFATLAAALIVPELTTFVLFLFVVLSVTTLFARQAWALLRLASEESQGALVPATADHAALRLVHSGPTRHPAE